jgi:hypothetical protein
MKWIADVLQPKHIHAEIEHFTSRDIISGAHVEGYYLYIWENGKGIADELQDTLEVTMQQAFEDYGVPLDVWKQVGA